MMTKVIEFDEDGLPTIKPEDIFGWRPFNEHESEKYPAAQPQYEGEFPFISKYVNGDFIREYSCWSELIIAAVPIDEYTKAGFSVNGRQREYVLVLFHYIEKHGWQLAGFGNYNQK